MPAFFRRIGSHRVIPPATESMPPRCRYARELARQLPVLSHGPVAGWVITTMAKPPSGGTPQLELTVREALDATYLIVIPAN